MMERKRLFVAGGVSLFIHLVLIIILSLWSLKKPEVQKRIPPLTVMLEPVAVLPSPVTEQAPAARKKQNPSVKKTLPPAADKKVPVKTRAASLKGQPVSSPEHKAIPASMEKDISNNKGPVPPVKITPKSTESLTTPKPLPKPRGSKIVYADAGTDIQKTPPVKEKPTKKAPTGVISSSAFNALAASLEKASSEKVSQTTTSSSAGSATPSYALPDTVSLDLGHSNTPRKPVSKLVLNIPEKLLQKIGHNSSLTVAFTLTPDGYIMTPSVVASQVGPLIEAKVLEALRKWEFNRGPSADGNVQGRITIRFRIK